MHSRLIILFYITALSAAVPGPAQETPAPPPREAASAPPAAPPPRPVTLRELVADTLANNPELQFYEAEIAAARGQLRRAGEWPNPTLGLEIGQKRASDTANILVGEGVAWSVSVTQVFDFSGRPALRKAIANRQVELATAGLEQFKRELEARVLELGWGLLVAQRQYEAGAEVAARAQAVRAVLVQRDPAGVAPLLENRAIEARVVVFERAAAQARGRLLAALQEINLLRGAPANFPLQVAAAGFAFRDAPPEPELMSLALQRNYTLQQRRIELEQQGFQISLARKDPWGEVKVSPFFAQENAGDREQIVGLAVELPLPVWQQNQGEILIARARRDQAQAALLVAQRDLHRDLAAAALAYKLSLENLRRWGAEAAGQFRDAADLGDRNYRLGTIGLSTYLELQAGYLDALAAILETESDALTQAARLALLAGVPMGQLVEATSPAAESSPSPLPAPPGIAQP